MSSAEQAAAPLPAKPKPPTCSTRSLPPPGRKATRKPTAPRTISSNSSTGVVKPGQVVSKDVETNIKFWIGEIDKKLSAQAQRGHAPSRFPEAGIDLARLALPGHHAETGENLKIRVLNASKRDLFKDLEKAAEFDQSGLFKKIYEEEYGQLGGQPYGMLVGDYEFGRTPKTSAC